MGKSCRLPKLPASYYENKPGVCRWCGKPIVDKDGKPLMRRRWHESCLTPFFIVTSSTGLRNAVYERDRGVCANCRVDTDARKALFRVNYPEGIGSMLSNRHLHEMYHESCKLARAWAAALGWPRHMVDSWWQADHIRPLYESEGRLEYFMLENAQTLCFICHKAKTRRDVKILAERRRSNPDQLDLDANKMGIIFA